jgi:hypothetical protein
LRGFLLVIDEIEGILKENEGRFESLEGIGELGRDIEGFHREIGELGRKIEGFHLCELRREIEGYHSHIQPPLER